jgi:hypothetical protein
VQTEQLELASRFPELRAVCRSGALAERDSAMGESSGENTGTVRATEVVGRLGNG